MLTPYPDSTKLLAKMSKQILASALLVWSLLEVNLTVQKEKHRVPKQKEGQSIFGKLSAGHSYLAPQVNRNPVRLKCLFSHASSVGMRSYTNLSRIVNICSLFRSKDLFWGRRR